MESISSTVNWALPTAIFTAIIFAGALGFILYRSRSKRHSKTAQSSTDNSKPGNSSKSAVEENKCKDKLNDTQPIAEPRVSIAMPNKDDVVMGFKDVVDTENAAYSVSGSLQDQKDPSRQVYASVLLSTSDEGPLVFENAVDTKNVANGRMGSLPKEPSSTVSVSNDDDEVYLVVKVAMDTENVADSKFGSLLKDVTSSIEDFGNVTTPVDTKASSSAFGLRMERLGTMSDRPAMQLRTTATSPMIASLMSLPSTQSKAEHGEESQDPEPKYTTLITSEDHGDHDNYETLGGQTYEELREIWKEDDAVALSTDHDGALVIKNVMDTKNVAIGIISSLPKEPGSTVSVTNTGDNYLVVKDVMDIENGEHSKFGSRLMKDVTRVEHGEESQVPEPAYTTLITPENPPTVEHGKESQVPEPAYTTLITPEDPSTVEHGKESQVPEPAYTTLITPEDPSTVEHGKESQVPEPAYTTLIAPEDPSTDENGKESQVPEPAYTTLIAPEDPSTVEHGKESQVLEPAYTTLIAPEDPSTDENGKESQVPEPAYTTLIAPEDPSTVEHGKESQVLEPAYTTLIAPEDPPTAEHGKESQVPEPAYTTLIAPEDPSTVERGEESQDPEPAYTTLITSEDHGEHDHYESLGGQTYEELRQSGNEDEARLHDDYMALMWRNWFWQVYLFNFLVVFFILIAYLFEHGSHHSKQDIR